MSNRYLLDTDVLIDYLRGIPQSVTFLEEIVDNSICYLSVITVAEQLLNFQITPRMG